MEKSTATASAAAAGPKVSQIANLFQRKPVELAQEVPSRGDRPTAECTAATHSPTATVVRTESHAARFNNARALFEKLGEGRVNRPPPFSIKMSHSSSKEDNLSDIGSGPDRSPSPKRKQQPPAAISNGIGKLDSNRILNQSRLKSEKPEKPEKPERKFNSRELIEKQKNWTSHFSKTRTAKGVGASEFNRCDIIRTVPGTGIIAGAGSNAGSTTAVNSAPTTNGNYSAIPNGGTKEQLPFAAERNGPSGAAHNHGHGPLIAGHHRLPSPSEPPPSPPKRQTPPPPPPEKGPRTGNLRQNSFPSPTKTPPAVPPHATDPSSLSPTKLSPEKLKPPPRQAEPPPTAPHANLPPVAPVRSSTTVLTTVHHQQQQQQQQQQVVSSVEQQVPPPPPEKACRKKSLEGNLDERLPPVPAGNGGNFKYPELGALARRQSSEKDTGSGGLTSPAHAISSSPSPGASASSGPSSPIHTEDEKQENESTEKLMRAGSNEEREVSRAEDSPTKANEGKPVEELNGK
uniref:Uncharacterized protein n=1 Tax=Anopheles epiroticus TaxID=199890 RepID=A0A182PH58_9DIPT